MVESRTPNPESASESTPEPHTTDIVAWDIPSTVIVGERFKMKIGIKCAHGCDLTDQEFGLYDHDGSQLAAGRLPAGHWPGTNGLHVAEVELEAPTTDGLYTWTVKVPSTLLVTSPSSSAQIPHPEASITFGVRIVCHPEYLVTVETVDRAHQTPLPGARVVMHPYRATTDDGGIAKVRVAKGTYKLFVSQTRYITFGLPIEVTSDVTTRAELDVEPMLERN